MPFGMKNAPATFQRMVNKLVRDIDGCEGYIDDVVIYSDDWSDHTRQNKRFFQIMREAKLTINLMKKSHCEILRPHCRTRASKTLRCKNSNHCQTPYPLTEELARFLGMAGYYRNFCLNFCQISRYGRILQEFLFEFFRDCCTANKFVKQKGKICLDR